MNQQFLAQLQDADSSELVYPVLVTLTQQHDDIEKAVRKLALKKLTEEGYEADDLDMIGCIELPHILTTIEPDLNRVNKIRDKILTHYSGSNLADGWIQECGGFIDMAFSVSIPDTNNDDGDEEYHCYLSFNTNTCEFNGEFAHWTPDDGMPSTNTFGQFKSLGELKSVEIDYSDKPPFLKTAIEELSNAVLSFASSALN